MRRQLCLPTFLAKPVQMELGRPCGSGRAQELYEALRGEPIDPANFRRDVRATGLLADTGELRAEGPGRPGRVFTRRAA